MTSQYSTLAQSSRVMQMRFAYCLVKKLLKMVGPVWLSNVSNIVQVVVSHNHTVVSSDQMHIAYCLVRKLLNELND